MEQPKNNLPTNMETQNNIPHIEVNNAPKYVVLSDGRMARLLKPVKVKTYLYYSYINKDGKSVRINVKDSLNINNQK